MRMMYERRLHTPHVPDLRLWLLQASTFGLVIRRIRMLLAHSILAFTFHVLHVVLLEGEPAALVVPGLMREDWQ